MQTSFFESEVSKRRPRLSPEPSCGTGQSSLSPQFRQVVTSLGKSGGRITLASRSQRARDRFCLPRRHTSSNNRNVHRSPGCRHLGIVSGKKAESSTAEIRLRGIASSFPFRPLCVLGVLASHFQTVWLVLLGASLSPIFGDRGKTALIEH